MGLNPVYSESFKIEVVQLVESGALSASEAGRQYGIRGHSTILKWRRKYGKAARHVTLTGLRRQGLKENNDREVLLENEIKELKRELEDSRLRNTVLETFIDVADRELGTDLRKKCGPKHAWKSKQ